MKKVVNIEGRIESRKQKKQLKLYRVKVDAIQKVIQCSSCHFKCAMCGLHEGETDSPYDSISSLGYTFCESCRGEFEDFLSISRGEKSPDLFWHNKEWINMWSAWLKYQQTIKGFMNSPEFNLLLKELDTQ